MQKFHTHLDGKLIILVFADATYDYFVYSSYKDNNGNYTWSIVRQTLAGDEFKYCFGRNSVPTSLVACQTKKYGFLHQING